MNQHTHEFEPKKVDIDKNGKYLTSSCICGEALSIDPVSDEEFEQLCTLLSTY